MRILLLLVAYLAIAPPAPTRVTAAQLEHTLTTARAAHKSDTQILRQLRHLELSERLTDATLGRLTTDLESFPETTQFLQLLADQSAFLNPPASEIPAIAPPDAVAQKRMLDAARSYVAQTLPLLPNLLATRTTRYFDDSPQQLTKNAWPVSAGLHLVDTSNREISVREDQETLSPSADSSARESAHRKQSQSELASWGEFGPMLTMIMADTANGKVSWSHWEQAAAGPVAVLSYSVPQAFSHYVVAGSTPQNGSVEDSPHSPIGLQQGPDISRTTLYRITPGYHGSLWLDPATGAILRISIEADLKDRDPVKRAGALVEYGPVSIGERSFICPMRSLTIHMNPINPNDLSGSTPLLKLNENLFTNYHRFASTTRILTEGQP